MPPLTILAHRIIWSVPAALILILDQISKWAIITIVGLKAKGLIVLLPIFNLVGLVLFVAGLIALPVAGPEIAAAGFVMLGLVTLLRWAALMRPQCPAQVDRCKQPSATCMASARTCPSGGDCVIDWSAVAPTVSSAVSARPSSLL